MSKPYKIQEVPDINDQRIYSFCFYVQNIQTVIHELLLSIIEENKKVQISLGIVFGLLHRIIECSTSIQLLAIKGRARDIAILLLNIMELRIDLQYMSLDSNRLQVWKNHENSWRKPWKLHNQLKEICKTEDELEAERDVYHLFSMIKHGNPASTYGNLNKLFKDNTQFINIAFSISSEPNGTRIDISNAKHHIVPYIFALGTNLYRACCAGLDILNSHGLYFPEIDKKLKQKYGELDKIIVQDIKEQIIQWNRRTDKEFREKWDALEELEKKLIKKRDALFEEMEALKQKIDINKKNN